MSLVPSQTVVSLDELPASCPPAGQSGWDKHPRVYLQLSASKPEQHCPYCGALFVLEDTKKS
ncbi:MAG: zinc-finger domain-containing protein [Gammaproteobacteria bacterium WSBS_2016_MAG_OTU1]